MSDFFDDENLVSQEDNKSPKEEKIIPKKKLLPKLIAGFLCVAILVGGLFAVIKFIPEKEDEDNTSSAFKTIEALKLDEDKVKSLSVTNENGTFSFSKITENDTAKWILEGVNADLLSEDKISSVINSATSIDAIRKITEKTEEQCGIDTSKIYAEIVSEDSSVEKIIFGDQSPDN